jgi:hypothetical protein
MQLVVVDAGTAVVERCSVESALQVCVEEAVD